MKFSAVVRVVGAMIVVPLLLGSCAQPHVHGPAGHAGVAPEHADKAASLQGALLGLSPEVRESEARLLAETAFGTVARLKRSYGVKGPALYHNMLVNVSIKERGLCFQWAEDLFLALYPLRLKTLDLHWGESRVGTWREHNCVVVTAKGQSFNQGIVLDAWRHSGRLHWARVKGDRYPWVLGSAGNLPDRCPP